MEAACYLRIAHRRTSFALIHTPISETSMHEPPTSPQSGRYIPFKQEGWGIALFVVLLAVAAGGWATYVHKTTYKHPTDLRFQATGAGGSHE
jgi:hypothetical protein